MMYPWLFIIFVIILAGFLVLLVLSGGGHEDRREVRHYGNLECVYNISTDKIESCAEVHGG